MSSADSYASWMDYMYTNDEKRIETEKPTVDEGYLKYIHEKNEAAKELEHIRVDEERVNHPSHYGGDTVYEAIKVIEAWDLNFNLGNCLKYISRAGKKDEILVDLKKASWYLAREIFNREKKDE